MEQNAHEVETPRIVSSQKIGPMKAEKCEGSCLIPSQNVPSKIPGDNVRVQKDSGVIEMETAVQGVPVNEQNQASESDYVDRQTAWRQKR